MHTPSACSALPLGWGSAESPGLVAKYMHVGTFDQETQSIFCSPIAFFSSTWGFTLHSAIPKQGKATSGKHTFVVTGGVSAGFLEGKNVPKHILIWLLPVVPKLHSTREPELNLAWHQTYTQFIRLCLIMDEVRNLHWKYKVKDKIIVILCLLYRSISNSSSWAVKIHSIYASSLKHQGIHVAVQK